MDMLGELREWQRRIDEAPPVVDRFIASYLVPADRVYRYWDTKGRLWVYVNRRAIEMLPKETVELGSLKMDVLDAGLSARFGTPVYFEGPEPFPLLWPYYWRTKDAG